MSEFFWICNFILEALAFLSKFFSSFSVRFLVSLGFVLPLPGGEARLLDPAEAALPDPPAPEQLPACCRGIVMDYSAEMLKLGDLLFGLFSEALGLDPAHLKEMGCSEGLGIASHYYPACPQPDLTLGIARHSDLGFVTVLLQDHVGGLQVFRRDRWVDFPPTPGALVVNVGDMFQLISNDKFKSVEHRALVRSVGPRVSVAAFFGNEGLSTSRIYEPIKELLSEDDPPKYHGITVRDFFFRSFQKGIDSSSILSRLKR
ncbi:unnamed protein product [Linum tenue]|uniref:Fe2OG dioxygenase domain-containing protein n=1 Tax=Linum tenue TaxID=586396 RepID=A0AAV0QJA7_9ROSI|nr:unnamed protein product [Linum tenue]